MKFRRLNNEELEGLKEEFINFLIVNGIDAAEWTRMKAAEPILAIHWIDVFSDFIFDGIVEKVKYIEYFDKQGIKLFHCAEDTIHLIGVESDAPFDTSSSFYSTLQAYPNRFNIYKTSKEYIPDRRSEVFRMIQSGGIVSNGEWWDMMSGIDNI